VIAELAGGERSDRRARSRHAPFPRSRPRRHRRVAIDRAGFGGRLGAPLAPMVVGDARALRSGEDPQAARLPRFFRAPGDGDAGSRPHRSLFVAGAAWCECQPLNPGDMFLVARSARA
jgi:hypothetical protein